MTSPALVVLAAGASRRLGTCKALVEIGGVTAIVRLLNAAGALHDARPLVVTGAHHVPIAAALAGAAAQVLENPAWEQGRTGGLALAALARPGRDLCVASVDQPLVEAGTFEALRAAWADLDRPALGWLAPRLEPPLPGRSPFGHPVLIGRRLVAMLQDCPPHASLRDLRARADSCRSVPVPDRAILDDLDTPEDLRSLREREGDPASGDGA